MKHGLRVDDLAGIKTIGSPAISPCGSTILYTLGTMNLKENRTDNDIHTVSPGEEPRKLTETGKAGHPTWSPDGEWIAYTEGEDKTTGIWVMTGDGEHKRKLTTYEVSNASLGIGVVGNTIKWSPDGSKLAYLATLEPYDKESKIRVIDRLMYKAFYNYSDMRRRHIFTIPTTGNQPPTQHTFGDYDEHSIEWTPDGKIIFISNRTGEDDLNMKLDIYQIDPETKEITQLTDTVGAIYYPKPSPDGEKIAFLSTTRANTSNESTPEDTHLWVMNRDGSNQRDISITLDRHCANPIWTQDSKAVYFTAADQGKYPIFKADLQGNIERVLDGERTHGNLSLGNGIMAYTVNDPVTPPELYIMDVDETKLTNHNNLEMRLSHPEEFWFKTSDDLDIQGWIYKPVDFDPSKKYPTLLSIKGGPSGMRGYSWNPGLQIPTSHGFIQIVINYRGSSGYGNQFSDAVVGDMLGGEYRDNIEALDHCIAKYPYIDPERLGVYGTSYGGYLTNWIITQTPRFKAAVSTSSISNLWSQWGCSAIPLWMEVELEAKPWEKPDQIIKQSPIWQAHKATTPTLFLHGELDFDTPICEAEQFFMVMKKMKQTARMVRYVDDGHGIRKKPGNYIDSIRRTIAWFKQYV
jgi:dipeptidyl aminopeptidase/acylaminoacyl peptidase